MNDRMYDEETRADKGPPERQSIAVSRSLTDAVGERIYCAVNNGARVTADRAVYLLPIR